MNLPTEMCVDKLHYYITKYGDNFFSKLTLYKTASIRFNTIDDIDNREYVKLLKYYPNTFTYTIEYINKQQDEISIFELDNYVV